MYTLAFDLGRVLFDFDFSKAFKRLHHHFATPLRNFAALEEELFKRGFCEDFEKGHLSPEAFHRRFSTEYKIAIGYDDFATIWCDIFSPKPEMIALVKTLRTLYPVYLISNIDQLHYEHLYGQFPEVFGLFRKCILSFQAHAIKPEKEIYNQLREACSCDFSHIIYIDDRPDLIDAARLFSINAIQFQDKNQLLEEFTKFNIKTCKSK